METTLTTRDRLRKQEHERTRGNGSTAEESPELPIPHPEDPHPSEQPEHVPQNGVSSRKRPGYVRRKF